MTRRPTSPARRCTSTAAPSSARARLPRASPPDGPHSKSTSLVTLIGAVFVLRRHRTAVARPHPRREPGAGRLWRRRRRRTSDGPEAQPVASGSELGQTWPLTGLDVSGDAAPRRPTRSWSSRSTTPRPAPRRRAWTPRTSSSRSWSRAAAPGSRRSSTPPSPTWSAGAVDARQRHRHRLPGRRHDGHLRRGRGDDRAHRGRRHHVLRRGRRRASTATAPRTRRTT